MQNRLLNYLKTLSRRTLIGANSTTHHCSGAIDFLIDTIEGLIGFFSLIILPAMTGAFAWHWLFD